MREGKAATLVPHLISGVVGDVVMLVLLEEVASRQAVAVRQHALLLEVTCVTSSAL